MVCVTKKCWPLTKLCQWLSFFCSTFVASNDNVKTYSNNEEQISNSTDGHRPVRLLG